jgi:hypothetical protein
MIRSALADKLPETRVRAALNDEIDIGDAPAGITVAAANGRSLTAASSSGNLRAKAERWPLEYLACGPSTTGLSACCYAGIGRYKRRPLFGVLFASRFPRE